MADCDQISDLVGPTGKNTHLRGRDLEEAINFSQPAIEKVYFRNYNQRGLAPLRNGIKGNNCFAALMTPDQGSAIVLKYSFGRILLVALQFAMKFDRTRVEEPPPVDHAVRNLVSFAQFDELVEESSGDEIISAFLFHTAYLGRDVADPFAAVVPHFVVRIGKNKPFVEFSLENGRQPLNRQFDPLGKQNIDIPDEHFQDPQPPIRREPVDIFSTV